MPPKAGVIPDGRGITKQYLPGSLHHSSLGQHRPLGADRIESTALLCSQYSSVQCHKVKPRQKKKSKKRSVSPPPPALPMYNTGRRVGPAVTVTLDVDADKQVQDVRVKNMIWLLTRLSNPEEDQTISSWTGFNILIRNDTHVVQDTVSYLPTINAPATEMSTVNEVLTQTVNIMDTLELKEIVCVFEQALHAKAAEITWKHEKFKNLILRMGAFHTICNLLSTIGKRFQDAGLRDLCVESGVIAEGSITAVMEGRKYNSAVKFHKIVYEAMMRLAWKGFLPWIQVNHGVEGHHLEEAPRSISTFHDDVSQACGTEEQGYVS